ncbi:MAG: DEAD/DEAH box helicase [Oligoflexales bacterium]|nr:DEAD/DEAH box helicase [Oligoflexales bacterium]
MTEKRMTEKRKPPLENLEVLLALKQVFLSAHFQSFFEKSIRERGFIYAERGYVKILKAQAGGVKATVKGTSRYTVTLNPEKERQTIKIYAVCSCPHFDEGNFCKHLWATLLVLDQGQWTRKINVPFGVNWDLIWDGYSKHFCDDDDDKHYQSFRSFAKAEVAKMEVVTLGNGQAINIRSKLVDRVQTTPRNTNWQNAFTIRVNEKLVTPTKSKQIEIWYGLCIPILPHQGLKLKFFKREESSKGIGLVRPCSLSYRDIARSTSGDDEKIFSLLNVKETRRFETISPSLALILLPHLLATKRVCRSQEFDNFLDVHDCFQELIGSWENSFCLAEASGGDGGYYKLSGWMSSSTGKIPLIKASYTEKGFFVFEKNIVFTTHLKNDEEQFVHYLVSHEPLLIPKEEILAFVEQLSIQSFFSKVELPESLTWVKQTILPEIVIALQKPVPSLESKMPVQIYFQYPQQRVSRSSAVSMWLNSEEKLIYLRGMEAEKEAWDSFIQTRDLEFSSLQVSCDAFLSVKNLSTFAAQIQTKGWRLEAEGRKVTPRADFSAFVSSGIDWFELKAQCRYGDQNVYLPKLLLTAQMGNSYVILDDGSVGLLPEEWLQKYAGITSFARTQKDQLRFCSSQAVLLDSLLAEIPHVDFDEKFSEIRSQIKKFTGIKAKSPSRGFRGALRPYQKEGLGWFHFLQDFGFGGCLADDMGLGKTIQVLALLHNRRKSLSTSGEKRTSLVVVPRILVHNWQEEAKKFCSKLTFYDYSTFNRSQQPEEWKKYDVVITTYAIMRTDIAYLNKFAFDYVILDEAQAIKNNKSLVARASLLLQGANRLAMSGTPVENHLGELASIFEFLNPGMLNEQVLKTYFTRGTSAKPESLPILANALRPFILRRTKEEVLHDLPPKSEQILYCELGPTQRKHYEDLKIFYRDSLAKTIGEKGLQRSKIQVLEALLRLRQAACHVGLIDKSRVKESSAKLDALLTQVKEVIVSKHKALIFSQFTSMLDIVRRKLDKEGIVYEYLDGKTRNRKSCVDRFQNDDLVRVFLISLKAGGVGLNLTAADYCFILDPWWNPAVEAQAIDRAHRIGQEKKVFAYRLIARNTVEEKILALQAKKKELFKTVLNPENSLIRSMSLDDIQLLLS